MRERNKNEKSSFGGRSERTSRDSRSKTSGRSEGRSEYRSESRGEKRSEGRGERRASSSKGKFSGESSERVYSSSRGSRNVERAEKDFKPRSSRFENKPEREYKSRGGSSEERGERRTFERSGRSSGGERQYPAKSRARDIESRSEKTTKRDVFKEAEETNTFEDDTRNTFIYGRHPVIEALKGETPINKVWIGENTRDTSEIVEFIKDRNIPYKIVNKLKLNHMVGENTNHQGVVAEVSGKEYTEFADLIDLCATKQTFFIILDKVEDPHNLGAIIRTADAAGVDGIIIPKYNAAGLTGIVAKTAAGALDRMKVSRVTNLAQVLDELKANNVWTVGVDMDGEQVYTQANLKGSIALVMGGEGQGLTRLLKEKCDFVVKIPMQAVANSLNVSVATAILTYEIYRQREFK